MQSGNIALVVVSIVGLGCGSDGQPIAEDTDTIAAEASLRGHDSNREKLWRAWQATERYREGVEVAEADGYVKGSPCEESEQGTMGIHYVHPEKSMAPPVVDDPAILVYLPTDRGLELVAIEYFQPVIQDGQPYVASETAPPREDSLPPSPPELFEGHPFDGPMAGHNPEMPWHYDQHVWFYAKNPAGLFAMWNPDLDCSYADPAE